MLMKYRLKCVECSHETSDFADWFAQNQTCPRCGSKHSEVWYNADYTRLQALFKQNPDSFWVYFDYLPLVDKKNIVSCQEGAIPLEEWSFLSQYAKEKYGLELQVLVYRNDLNGGTGTFKDVAASLAASLLKENNIHQYCIASTGNTATAYALYLSLAGVNASIFIPDNALKASEAMISAYGQQVLRVKGDYAEAKKIANQYSAEHHVLISGGNVDPIRVEAKKTMVFEWLRQIGKLPDVYIQAVSGGTGPIALDKGIRELVGFRPDLKLPRLLMVQPDRCDPMVQAWEKAEAAGFPPGHERHYPVIDNPQTSVPTLATGNPATYPIIANLVKKSGGTFLRMKEDKLADYARLAAFEHKVLMGPASAVCIGGFFEALEKGLIRDGECVLLNSGEGVRRAPDFVNEMISHTKQVETADECQPHTMSQCRRQLWQAVEG